MTIIYLYTEIMPYVTTVFSQFSKLGHTVYAFYKDKERQTPFEAPPLKNVKYLRESEYSNESLLQFAISVQPDILLVAGWTSKKYLNTARYFKKQGQIPVVCPIDSQFLGTVKQRIGFILSPLLIKPYFSHIWVPGVRQYDFARRMGFDHQHIILNSLTADTNLFLSSKIDEAKGKIYPKRLLFVGRYNEVKGLDLLLKAWGAIKDKKGWKITLVGNGPMKDFLLSQPDVEVLDFMSQDQLKVLAEHSGVFVLPSKYEPWALVLQEFAAAGLPILCSDTCGASPYCVINGYNGFTFKSGDVNDLVSKLEILINLSSSELLVYSHRSRKMSGFVTPEISAASLLGVLAK